MGQTVLRYLGGRVIYASFNGTFAANDLPSFDAAMGRLLNQGIASVHFIVDIRQTQTLPPVTAQMKLTFPRHPNLGWAVILTQPENSVATMLLSLTTRLFRVSTRTVNNLQDALGFLEGVDPTLPDLRSLVYEVEGLAVP